MLTTTTKNLLILPVARIAQSVEQRIENPRVGGSIPPPGTISKGLRLVAGLFDFWIVPKLCPEHYQPHHVNDPHQCAGIVNHPLITQLTTQLQWLTV